MHKGLCKVKKFPKIQKKIGSGWVGPGLICIKKNWKIVQKQSFASVQFVPICPLWCNNIKSKIGVGRHAVSRYHQLKKFFIAGDDPDYRDQDSRVSDLPVRLHGHPAPTVRQHTRRIRPQQREVWTHRQIDN